MFVAVLAPVLILGQGFKLNAVLTKANRSIFYSLMLFFFANVVSAAFNATPETVMAVVLRCILPLLVYLSLAGLVLRRSDVTLLVLALAAGGAFIFVRGLSAYVAEWGIPDLRTVLWARYDVVRMAGYAEVTLGNVAQMGLYVVLVLPPLLIAALSQSRHSLSRWICALVWLLGAANLVVSGSRTGLAVLLLATMITVFSLGRRGVLVIGAAIVSFALATVQWWSGLIHDREIVDRYLPFLRETGYDNSARERYDSIVIGWQTFSDHIIVGVGPDMSRFYNQHFIPHQSFVHQLSELGVFGGAAFIWLNAVVLFHTFLAFQNAKRNTTASHRFLWLLGPSSWFFFGAIGGLSFNASTALVWIGIVHAMLAISGATILPPRLSGNPARLRGTAQ